MNEKIFDKLQILSMAAKYDVSCSSSGVARKNNKVLGSSQACGICHTWSADGRCVSLLKVLLSNKCVFNCAYCVSRRDADIERASFEPEELAQLTIEFYRRNYIEGLFLSSGVEVSPDYTAEKMIKTLLLLRKDYGFAGYIHAKIIPGTSQELVCQIGFLADRTSVNMELPTDNSLKLLAPQKTIASIATPMKFITSMKAEFKLPGNMKQSAPAIFENGGWKSKKFVPAGQTTQLIIGASSESDRLIVKASEQLYQGLALKRVYYSAYIPMVKSSLLPALSTQPPLLREHRLYQADWLLRFYHFQADELLDEAHPFLDLEVDPKVSWAIRNPGIFPMEINRVCIEELLRIPGIGVISAERIIRQRRMAAVKFDQLKLMGVVVKRAKYFITCCGKYYGDVDPDSGRIREMLVPAKPQEEQMRFLI